MTHESEGLPGIYKARQKANAAEMKDKLLPCPFCGNIPEIKPTEFPRTLGFFQIFCCIMIACDTAYKTKAAAIKDWNRRLK